MLQNEVTIRPTLGRRAQFEALALSGLTTGTVLALGRPNPEPDLLVLIESAAYFSRETGRMPAGPYPGGVRFSDDVIRADFIVGTLTVLAQFDGIGLSNPPQTLEYGVLPAYSVTDDMLEKYYASAPITKDSGDQSFRPTMLVGNLLSNNSVRVAFSALGFMRHTALLAQSGSGKSYALGVLLEELIGRTTARLIVVDPNGDFRNLGRPTSAMSADADFAALFTQRMSSIAIVSSGLSTDYARFASATAAGGITSGAICDLNNLDPRLWDDILLKILESLWERKDTRTPTIIVLDEAHNFASHSRDSTRDPLLATLIRIAGEGRKYGLWLIIASQRPQKLHPNVISQCDNLIVMKLTGRGDTDHIVSAFNAVSRDMVELSYGFQTGEALAVGRIVRSPTLLKFRQRRTEEGGADLSVDWAKPTDN